MSTKAMAITRHGKFWGRISWFFMVPSTKEVICRGEMTAKGWTKAEIRVLCLADEAYTQTSDEIKGNLIFEVDNASLVDYSGGA